AGSLASRWPWTFSGSEAPATAPDTEAAVCYGHVDLEHGVTPLYPLQPGRVARLAVQENEPVCAGAPLLYLADESARLQVEEARAAVEVAELQLAEARSAPAQHQLHLEQQEAVCAATESKLAAARQQLQRKKELEASNLINTREVSIAQEQVNEIEAVRR